MGEYVLYQKEGPIGRITLNRPEKRNALNPAALKELIERFTQSHENNDLCVIYGAAGKDFTVGADLKHGYQMMVDPARADEGKDLHRHRPSAHHHRKGGQDPRHSQGQNRRDGHPRRAAGKGSCLLSPLPAAVCQRSRLI